MDASTADTASPTIVLVDDDASTRYAMTQLLEMEDYVVHEAADGLEALSVIAETKPALVLSDVRMPKMSGDELVAEVRGREGPPVILMTAHSILDHAEAAELGAAGLIHKPVKIDDLYALIERTLRANPPPS